MVQYKSPESLIFENRYLIGSLLGGTGLAYVHKAFDTQTSNDVVIKFLRPYFLNDENSEAISTYFSFLDSIKTLETDSVLKPIDYGSSKGSIWVVYPYIRFQTLEDRIRAKELPLSPLEVILIVNNICGSLEYLHTNNIIHNNLKPSNIFTSDDFLSVYIEGLYMAELAQSVNELTRSSLNTPNPYYSSHEHGNGILADADSDIYSLASIAYHLLLGVLPFSGTRESVLYYKSVQSPKLPTETIPIFNAEVDSVFLKALNSSLLERYRSCRDFADALEESLKDIEISLSVEPKVNFNNLSLQDNISDYACVFCGQQNTPENKLCSRCWSPLTQNRITTIEKAEKKEQVIIRTVKFNRFSRWMTKIGLSMLLGGGIYFEIKPPSLVPSSSTNILTSLSGDSEWGMQGRNFENWSSVGNDQAMLSDNFQIKGEVAWVKDTGESLIASASIKNDRLIIPTSADKILALNPKTGDKIWEFSTSGPIDSSPAITDSMAYIGLRDGRLLALDVGNGELNWEFITDDPIMSPPLVFKGTVYFGTAGGSVYSVDALNGDYLWHFTSDGWITTTPVINNDTIVISNNRAWVYVIDTKTGATRLTYNTYGKNVSSPILIGDNALLGLGTGKLLFLDTRQKEYRFERFARFWRAQFFLWGFEDKAPVQKGYVWQSRVARPDIGLTGLSVAGDSVYFGTSDGYIYAFDLNNRKILWRTKVGIGVTASPIVVGGQIFVGTNEGLLHSVDKVNGEVQWTIQTGGPIKAQPTWANGFLYFASTDGKLYAIR